MSTDEFVMNTTSEPSTRDGSVEVDTPGTSVTTPSMIGNQELENLQRLRKPLLPLVYLNL
ncbi:unnamed protein product [Rhizopus microsporus]